MRSRILVGVTSLLVLWLGAAPVCAQKKNPRLKALEKARYTLVEGVLRALRAVPGTVVEAEAEVEKEDEGYEVSYKVIILRGGRLYLVEVSGETGKVEKTRKLGKPRAEEHEEEEGERGEEHERGEREEKGEREEEHERGEREEKGEREEAEDLERPEIVDAPGEEKERCFLESFESARKSGIPRGWIPAETNSAGRPGTWKVVKAQDAPKGGKVMALVRTTNRGHTFNLLLTKKVFPADLALSVRIKAGTGREDQGGGLVWRALDADNYYITRWNPLEDNFRLYKVVRGRRSMITGVRLKVDPGKWHKIMVKTKGKRIRVYFDGRLYLEAEDSTFSGPGRVGLWTKADAASFFDDFQVCW